MDRKIGVYSCKYERYSDGNYEGAILLHRSALHVLSSILGLAMTSKQSSIDISKSCAFIIDAGHAYGGIELTDSLT